MPQAGYSSYKQSNIGTADRGKLIVMIYDHCLKWCKLATEKIESKDIEGRTKAIFKIQDGLTELTCALDMDGGGDLAKNLFNLYGFYNKHLTVALQKKDPQPVKEVAEMLESLRKAWMDALESVRQSNRDSLKDNSGNQIRMVG